VVSPSQDEPESWTNRQKVRQFCQFWQNGNLHEMIQEIGIFHKFIHILADNLAILRIPQAEIIGVFVGMRFAS